MKPRSPKSVRRYLTKEFIHALILLVLVSAGVVALASASRSTGAAAARLYTPTSPLMTAVAVVPIPRSASLQSVSPTLGNYADKQVGLSGGTTVTPDAAPTNATGINVSTNTNFKGTLSADPATGVVRVTDAHPAGTYTVTVKASNATASVTKSFTLTVQPGTACSGATQFSNAADVGVGSVPQSLAIGDFNNDGKQDLAIANSNSNTVSIRLGDGAGGFTSPATSEVTVGDSPYSVAIGDFNNDGNLDFATANLSGTVSIRLGDGLGGFTSPGTPEVTVDYFAISVAIGDFNGDGNLDFATANEGRSADVSIRLGDGAGGFTSPATPQVALGTSPFSVAIGDFNGDGKQDFATANNNSNNVSIRLGDGAGGFTSPVTPEVSVGSKPLSVAIGDFNGDGKQDFATANNNSNNVSIRLGDGAGGFTSPVTPEVGVGSNPYPVAIGDFNNDGKQDFAVANESSINVSIRIGDGAGAFTSPATPEIGVNGSPVSVAIGDFNGDGKQDFAAANLNGTVSIRLGVCNLRPTITAATGLSRQQGSASSNSQIATVTDDGGAGNVTVTVTSANPSNGVTVSNVVNTGGAITADVVADCSAVPGTPTSFTLQASDGISTSTATLNVTVTADTAPVLSYQNQIVAANAPLTINPATGPSDNVSVASIAVQHTGTYTGTISVNNTTGVVTVSNAAPVGTHTITIRATDNCGVTTDATFNLQVRVPTLGNYANQQVGLSGSTTVTPDAAPTTTTGINVSTNAKFKGTLSADPATGVVRVTDAHPAGTYAVTVTALFNATATVSKLFTLTVQQGTSCTGVTLFNNAADVGAGSNPVSVAIGDFNNDGKQDFATANQNSGNVSIRWEMAREALPVLALLR